MKSPGKALTALRRRGHNQAGRPRPRNTETSTVMVDAEGTVWVWSDRHHAWRYITWHGLSFEDHHRPPERYGPYAALDAPAATMIATAAKNFT